MKISKVLLLSGVCAMTELNVYGVEFDPDIAFNNLFKKKMDIDVVTRESVKVLEDYEQGRINHDRLKSYMDHNDYILPFIVEKLSLSSDTLSLYEFGLTYYHVKQFNIQINNINQLWDSRLNLIIDVAEKGDSRLQYLLGQCYYKGVGVDENADNAIKWYEMAAQQGHVDSQCNLGWCYSHAGNYKNAAEWWGKAATQGNTDAQEQLAMCYRDGEGVLQDIYKAAEWFKKAVEQGNNDAQEALDELEEDYPELFEDENPLKRKREDDGSQDEEESDPSAKKQKI